ncbi:YdcF family protein [Paenibacillus hodogayensis]|uniref:YdcF family protein n=1 Tax=Paenibacillus hodogayensis TaxID=279208 RepID=A0ABV5VVE7_9BACL
MRKQTKKLHPIWLILRLLLSALLLAGLYVGSMSWMIMHTWKTSRGSPADCIIVLGAAVWNGKPSPALRERLDVALDAWNHKLAPMIIATGGIGLPGEPSEASVIKSYLAARGVPAEAILVEDNSRNTRENLANSQELMREHDMRSAVLVTHGYHALRARMTAETLGIPSTVEPVQIKPLRLAYYTLRECGGIAYLLATTSPLRSFRAFW